jgi:iron complex outermembrane recepter protein
MFLLQVAVPQTSASDAVYKLEGTVLDLNQRGVPNASVSLVNTTRSTRSDKDGLFRFIDVPVGHYLIDVFHPTLGQHAQEVVVSAKNVTGVTIQLERLYHMDEVVVTAGAERRQSDAYQGVSILSNRTLATVASADLGETLSGEPGMSATSFGPGASRPLIRGLGGSRVRILEAGVATGDVSDTSPDHAVSIEPAAADRIEIIRGPATLLYGSSAVGGVVNVFDGRIPNRQLSRSFEGTIQGSGATGSDELVGGATLKFGHKSLVFSVGGSRRDSDDYAIPGFANIDGDEVEDETEEHHEIADGHLPNSFTETTRGAMGLSFIGQDRYLGISWSGLDKTYGLPGGHLEAHDEENEEDGVEGLTPHEEEGDVAINLEQRRFDLEGSWNLAGTLVNRVKARVGVSDYTHREREGEKTGTVFDNKQWEMRLEAEHRPASRVRGTFGFQIGGREFSAIGEEAVVPHSDGDQLAFFIFEELNARSARYQLGARIERQSHVARGARSTDHVGLSLSAGAYLAVAEKLTLSLSASRSQRLPVSAELYSNGPHLATNSYDIGDTSLEVETAYSLDLSARLRSDHVNGELTWFVNAFDRFIFQDDTGETVDGLSQLVYRQTDARFVGFEASTDVELLHKDDHHVVLTGKADWVRATRRDIDTPLPRIPPFRVGIGLRYGTGVFQGGFDVTRHAEQGRVAINETPTDGYTMVNAEVSVVVLTGHAANEITLRATNLGNVEARNHASLLKGQAPLPGRSARLLYRLHF